MLRQATALVFLARFTLLAQQPTATTPAFTQPDMVRLIEDMKKELVANTQSATQALAQQFSAEMQEAAKAPVAQRAAAMQKATDDYKKRVDAFNQGGQAGTDLGAATSLIVNPLHPQNGYYQNMVDTCLYGNKFLTRTEDGMPVLQQVTGESGATVIHTFSPGLPTEKTASSQVSPKALCPTLVRNAIKPTPRSLANTFAPSSAP